MSGKIKSAGMHGSGLVSNELSSVGNFYGAIQSFAWAVDAYPSKGGWIPCDGAAIGRTDYPSLFAVISTTWGAGNGSTTFNVPDLRGATLRQAGASGTHTQGNTSALSGGNLGSYTNDQIQASRWNGNVGQLKVGGPQYQSGFVGRTIGSHGHAYRTGVFYYDHTQGGNSPYSSQFMNWNRGSTTADNTNNTATDGATPRVGGHTSPANAAVYYAIYGGEKFS